MTTVTETDNHIDTSTHTKEQDTKDTDSEKITTYATQSWSINALAGIPSLTNPTSLVYGAQIEYRVIGPIQSGIFAFTDGRIGMSLGIRF